MDRYVAAVWIEKKKETVGVNPTLWVANGKAFYPSKPTSKITDMIRKCVAPESNWLEFPLIKVKYSCNSYNECEHNGLLTTDDDEGKQKNVIKKINPCIKFGGIGLEGYPYFPPTSSLLGNSNTEVHNPVRSESNKILEKEFVNQVTPIVSYHVGNKADFTHHVDIEVESTSPSNTSKNKENDLY
ncbi:uncharacterized protein LOC124811397 [Hydra vulgaris]|uniref:uncharacterized protein LOC124811397 n=1 Tax=Hydra vulgaris TaxID=6087 RepID=UPI001F5F7597|nr:uncharacterized protein LOC124811397 [Hydra vulgaris]